jgi:transmembrane sensor
MTQQQKLCIKCITGNISEPEKRELDKWLAQSSNNKNEFEQLNNIWKRSEVSQLLKIPDVNLQWEEIRSKIENKSCARNAEFSKDILWEKIIDNWKPVFTSAILLVIIALYFVYNNSEIQKNTILIKAGKNQIKEFSLPEGSYVKLSSNSSISYTEEFGEQNREIFLKGEGFFSVKKSKHPFLIQTENAEVKVTGTQFYVLANENVTRIYVKEGKVNYFSKNPVDAGREIARGQIGIVSKHKNAGKPVNVNPELAVDWMNGKFDYERKPLDEIINELEVYYDVKIEATKEALNTGKLTGTFSGEKIENILDMICLALHLDYEKRYGGYFIKTIDK